VISEFANDKRVLLWDLYNEPDNRAKGRGRAKMEVKNKAKYSLELLRKTHQWAREINPMQPLTIGIWRGNIPNWGSLDKLPELDRFMLENSDVISFHAYDGKLEDVTQKIDELKKYNRPLFCTEYLARAQGNTFELLMPLFKKKKLQQ